jgi:low affinity Fe/Cu permease
MGTQVHRQGLKAMLARGATSWITYVGTLTSRPSAFAILGAYVGAWLILDASTLNWHAVATILTWAMTLFIQRAEHRDTQAIQAKLDELLRSSDRASNEMTTIDEREPEEIEEARANRAE